MTSINFRPNVDPNTYAQQYASKNNISVDEAKTQLRSLHGEPDKNSSSIFGSISSNSTLSDILEFEYNSKNSVSDKTREADDEVVAYANYHNVSYDEARNALRNIFGDPADYDNTSSSTSTQTDSADRTTTTKDNRYKEVADALGYDALSVSAVMKAIEDGTSYTGRPEEVVPKLAYDLGLPESFVSNVLKYLNNNQI